MTKIKNKKLMALIIGGVAILIIGGVAAYLLFFHNKSNSNGQGVAFDYQKTGNIELGNYKELTASLKVTSDDIESEKEYLLDENTSVEQLEGTIKDGDTVNIDFEGKVNGAAFEGGTSEDYDLAIGSGEFIDGFEQQLVGVKTGDTVEIKATFPSDYGDDELDGKEAVFSVKVNYIHGKELEKVFNDEFVQRISDGKYKTVAEYEENMKTYLYDENKDYLPDTVWQELVDTTKVIKYPKKEVSEALRQTKEMYKNFAEVSGYSVDDLGVGDEEIKSMANDSVADRMIAKTIAAKEGIKIDDAYMLTALMDEMEYTAEDGKTLDDLLKEYKEGYSAEPYDDMLIKKVKEYVASIAKVEN